MATIKGYKWATKELAEAAQATVNQARNLPNSYVSNYFGFELGTDPSDLNTTFYFAVADTVMENILGPSSEFEIYNALS